ncbi:MAG TPA: hypothetical protein VM937_06575 [Burkholderiaceae bacterium]|nr:hypothetical protein [Burkholderiaceae bacterium]
MTPALYIGRFDSQLPEAWEAAQIALLTLTERARLARINRPQRRQQFIVGHCLLRWALVAAGLDEATVEVDSEGRVLLGASVPVHASIAHTGTAIAVVVAGVPIGVDVESMHAMRDSRAAARMLGLPDDQSHDARSVVRAWSITEARLKAGAQASAAVWLTAWQGCQLAVAGIPNPPLTGMVDAMTGIYNATELPWEAV